MTISLTNTTRRIKVFNLPHNIYCKTLENCSCSVFGERRLPSSLTILAGATVAGLEEAILRIPEVVRGIRKSELRVRRDKPEQPVLPIGKPKQKSSRKKGR